MVRRASLTPVRSFSAFRVDLTPAEVAAARAAQARTLATWGYLLLRPGMEFVRQRSNFLLGWPGPTPALGSWMILPDLTTPATRTVLPSHDALYGAAHLELDQMGPVRVHVPANIDDRYYSVSVMDAHFNNVARIGPKWTGNGAGDYLLVPPGWEGSGENVIEAPTPSVCLFNRMLVIGDDLDPVRQWQAGLCLEPERDATETADFVHPDINTMTDAGQYLRIGLAHLEHNPLVAHAQWLADEVRGIDLTQAEAVEAGVDDATAILDATLTTWPRVNGWMRPDPALGRPNPQVARSAAFQQFQIGSNEIQESAYYFVDTDAEGDLLDASDGRVYEVAFERQPPVEAPGYWSVTMYDEDSFLVANPLNRYVLRPGGPATIVCSAESPPDAANWLPAPDGRFRLGLRAYYPQESIISGLWMPPAVTRR